METGNLKKLLRLILIGFWSPLDKRSPQILFPSTPFAVENKIKKSTVKTPINKNKSPLLTGRSSEIKKLVTNNDTNKPTMLKNLEEKYKALMNFKKMKINVALRLYQQAA
jgi:hypothetical protein